MAKSRPLRGQWLLLTDWHNAGGGISSRDSDFSNHRNDKQQLNLLRTAGFQTIAHAPQDRETFIKKFHFKRGRYLHVTRGSKRVVR